MASSHRATSRWGRAVFAAATTAWLAAPAARAHEAELPPGFELVEVASGHVVPVDLTFAPDGTLFLTQKTGVVRVFDPAGELQAAPFINLSDEVNNNLDRGLLALALHPGFLPDGGPTSWVYLLYTVSPVDGQDMGFDEDDQYSFSRLARWRADLDDDDLVADLDSRDVLIGHQLADGRVPDGIASLYHAHSNGEMLFGSDGSLLFAVGDGAHWSLADTGGLDDSGFDAFVHSETRLRGPTPAAQDSGALRSQDLDSLAGKVCRVDPETGRGYPSNPFFDGDPASNASKVWALGLRNPYRMALLPGTGCSDPERAEPGVLVLGEVGHTLWEELDVCRGGENFGWPCFEGPALNGAFAGASGSAPGSPSCGATPAGQLTAPALAWHHGQPGLLAPAGLYVDALGQPLPGFIGRCAIGGAVYTGGSYPAEYAGRLFFADFALGWMRTAELDGAGELVAVRDFGTGTGAIVEIEAHPLTGELFVVDILEEAVFRLRFGSNLTPVPQAAAAPAVGPAPLQVQLHGSSSFDPDGEPLDFLWDFGDGTPGSTAADPLHTYTADGIYEAVLTVTDPGGLSASAAVIVGVGQGAPGLSITSPHQGQAFDDGETLVLAATAVDPDGGPLAYAWVVDLVHDTHVHPEAFTSGAPQATFPTGEHGGGQDLVYYKVSLTVTDDEGLVAQDHVVVYPASHVRDVSGTALPISAVAGLSPTVPTGNGCLDVEVVRDAVEPPAGSTDGNAAFATAHDGDQGDDDWLGYALASEPADELHFVALRFQEGLHAADGGWWEELGVEVRHDGLWTPVANLQISPAYPFELADEPGFDDIGFQTYELRFDPVHGDAVRLRGEPGGSGGHVSCAELRALVIDRLPPEDGLLDRTGVGTVIAKLLQLDPPWSLGGGNPDPETIRNGTWPPVGSTSKLAQLDSQHNGDQGDHDWIGYAFDAPPILSRLLFQEGLQTALGGAFDALGVEVQGAADGPWTSVSGLTVTPPYAGLDGETYESFSIDFDPVAARAIRLAGTLAGARPFLSVGELRALGPDVLPPWTDLLGGSPGSAGVPHLSGLGSPASGAVIALALEGTPPGALCLLWISVSSTPVDVLGGTLYAVPAALAVLLATDAAGTLTVGGALPAGLPSGTRLWFQYIVQDLTVPAGILLSNAMQATVP